MSTYKCEDCDANLKFQQLHNYEPPFSECPNCHQEYILQIKIVGDSNELEIKPVKLYVPYTGKD